MKVLFVLIAYLVFANSTDACENIINKAVIHSGTAAIVFELGSAISAYMSPHQFNNGTITSISGPTAQSMLEISFFVSAVSLIAALYKADPGTMRPFLGTASYVAALSGTLGTIISHQLSIEPSLPVKISLYAGMLGFASHTLSVLLVVLKRFCHTSEHNSDYLGMVNHV